MGSHWDAAGVAFILTALFVLTVALIDRGYTRTANGMRATHRVLRGRDRAAYWRLHHRYAALCMAGTTVEQAAAQAMDVTTPDEPIPYEVAVHPSLPDFTGVPDPAASLGAIVDAMRKAAN